MTYELLGKQHLPEIIELFTDAFNAEPWNDCWTEKTAERRLLQTMKFPDSLGLVAFEHDKAVGFILGHKEYYCEKVQFVIDEFCVDKNIKGKGIGTKIISELESRLDKEDINEILLMTLGSPATKKFYEKCGYKTMPELIMMSKHL